MKRDEREKGLPVRKVGARPASSPKPTSMGDTSPSHTSSFSIQPGDVSLTKMLEALKPHDHLSLIYESQEEWRAAAVPFIAMGLKRGEKCCYFADTHTAEQLHGYLQAEDVDVASTEASGQLVILCESEAYTKEGSFDPDLMIRLLITETEKAVAEGYPALRLTGEMTWVLHGLPGSERLLEYEAKLNRDFYSKYPALGICQYDRWKFDPEIIKGVIMTHPLLVRGNRIYHNFYYVPPEEFLNRKRAELEVQHWLNNVEREQRIMDTLRKSEEKFRSIFETTPAGIGISIQHVLKEVNHCLCVMTGYSRDELLNKSIRLVYQGDKEFQRVKQELYKQLANTGGGTLEACWRRKNGEVLNVFMQASPLNPLDLSQGIVFAVTDITERERAEEQLQQSEEKARQEAKQWQTTFDATNDGICTLDAEQRIQRCNRAFSKLLNKDTSEIIGRHCWELIHRTEEPIPECPILRMKESLSRESMEVAIDKKWFVVTVDPILNEAGTLAGAVHVLHDTTERKRAGEALHKEKQFAESLIDTAQAIILVLDTTGRIVSFNRYMEEVSGYHLEEVQGRDWFSTFLPEDDQHRTKELFLKAIDGIQTRGNVDAIVTKDGRTLDIEWYDKTLKDKNGDTVGLLAIGQDVTERKQAGQQQQLSMKILATLNKQGEQSELVREILELIKEFSDCEAVGIRLQKGEDFPYYQTNGFIPGHVEVENRLCAVDQKGEIIRDATGNPVLECMCGIIIRGRFDPTKPFFTKGGSFWTNCTTELLASTTEEDRQARTRNRCNGEGYESVALIPLKAESRIIGLLQLNDFRRNRFTPELIAFYEGIGQSIGVVLARIQMEQALCESEKKYRLLAVNSIDIIWTMDMDLRFTYMSPSVERVRGYTVEEVMAQSLEEVFTPSSLEIAVKAFAEELALESMEPKDMSRMRTLELEHICKDGSTVWVEINASFLRDTDGQPIGILGVSRDITDRRKSGESLRQSEEKYRTILAEIADSYFEVDLAGNLTFANDATCRNLRYSREELIGMNYQGFTAEDDIEHVYQAFNEVYRTDKPNKGFLWKIIRKDGSTGFADASVSLLRSQGGEIVGFRGVGRDITERKMADEERMQLELKAQITSRLASVGEMAAGVAHEINNPLTAVTGYAQLLVGREDIPSDIRSDLEAINDGAQRVAGIVRTLLAFSRQTKPQRKLVDINELIESTLVLRAYHLRVNNIEVVSRLATDVLETVADPGQIQQVLLNLIVNAETEMKLAHGKGKLTITTKKSDNTIKICVKDDGPGIKPELMDKIFDPFFTTREVGQGTGLGLSLCYGIVTEHKGKIYAESKPGKGATFIVELPVVTEAKPPKPAKPVVKKSKRAVKARILVVDDEQVVRDVVNRVLTREGYKVETVDNAADALKKIESQRYKLILVDIKMPGMDGVTLYKRIQKIAKPLARRVVFITGDIMGADTEKFLSEAKVAHIDKPFDAEQLSREVRRALTAGR